MQSAGWALMSCLSYGFDVIWRGTGAYTVHCPRCKHVTDNYRLAGVIECGNCGDSLETGVEPPTILCSGCGEALERTDYPAKHRLSPTFRCHPCDRSVP